MKKLTAQSDRLYTVLIFLFAWLCMPVDFDSWLVRLGLAAAATYALVKVLKAHKLGWFPAYPFDRAPAARAELRFEEGTAAIMDKNLSLAEGQKPWVRADFAENGSLDLVVAVPRGQSYENITRLSSAIKEAMNAQHVVVAKDTRLRQGGKVLFTVFFTDAFADAGAKTSPVVAALKAPERKATNAWDPVQVGWDAAYKPVHVTLPGQTVLVGGSPGAGKSAMTWQMLLTAAADPGCVLCVIDLKPEGVETGPIEERANYYVTDHGDPDEAMNDAIDLLKRLDAEMSARFARLKEWGKEKADESTGFPPVVLFVDEASQFAMAGGDSGKEALRLLTRIVQVGRAAGIGVVLITQKPDSTVIPTALRDLMGQRICFRTGNREQAKTILGDLDQGVEPEAISVKSPGEGYVKTEGEAVLFKSFYIDREDILTLAKRVTAMYDRVNQESQPYELAEPKAPRPELEATPTKEASGRQPRKPRKPRAPRQPRRTTADEE